MADRGIRVDRMMGAFADFARSVKKLVFRMNGSYDVPDEKLTLTIDGIPEHEAGKILDAIAKVKLETEVQCPPWERSKFPQFDNDREEWQ